MTRLQLSRVFAVHVDSVRMWLDEGLRGAALVKPGGPGRAALFDGRAAIKWFNEHKCVGWGAFPSLTLDDLRAIAGREKTR